MAHARTTTRRWALLCTGALLANVPAIVLVPRADALVVCQRKKKLTLRPGDACRKKETKIADLGAFATTSRLQSVETGLAARLASAEHEVGLVCPGAPARAFVPTAITPHGDRLLEGCRTLGADASACNGAFESLDGRPVSCLHYGGACVPCSFGLDALGVCQNACAPLSCPGAPARIFRGRADADMCDVQPTQAECEAAFVLNDLEDDPTDAAATCFWDAAASKCRTCTPTAPCVNGCLSP